MTRVRRALPEILTVAGILMVLEYLIFLGFFRGDLSPQFDFMGAYNAEAFAWWRDGGFFRPIEWMPYAWGGYPSAVALQSSAWYLPIGVPAMLTDYNLHVAAAVQALHVAFGALGFYVLGRAWRLGRIAATLGLVAGFFAPGYFANAQHMDIVRGYAWAPWLLLLLSPAWPWRRWWGVPVAALMLWQALVGVYPGMIVAFAYVGIGWVLLWQLLERPRLTRYLLPLAAAGILAALMACLKFLPALAVRTSVASGAEDSAFNLGILGTLFFPYDGDNLPTDMSMRPFFLPATVVVLLVAVPWRDVRARIATAVGVFCILVSMPFWPWFDALGALPGFDLSRFRISDYKPMLLGSALLLAMLALSHVIHQDGVRRLSGETWYLAWRRPKVLVGLGAVLALAAGLGYTQGFTAPRWAAPLTILVTASILVAFLVGTGSPGWRALVPDSRLVAGVLVALTVVSGVSWAYATMRPWRADRVGVEVQNWGRPIDSFIAERGTPENIPVSAVLPAEQRPARTPLTQDPVPVVEFQNRWNISYFNGTAAVGGYTNLKGNEAHTRAMAAFQDPATAKDALAWYAAPGIVIAAPADTIPTASEVDDCVEDQLCGRGLEATPAGYAIGHLTYEIRTTGGPVQLNEASYPGWIATLCPATSSTGAASCTDLTVGTAAAGNVALDLPSGNWTLSLDYDTPRLDTAWTLFWVGLAGVVLWAAVALTLPLVRRRRVEPSNRPELDPPA